MKNGDAARRLRLERRQLRNPVVVDENATVVADGDEVRPFGDDLERDDRVSVASAVADDRIERGRIDGIVQDESTLRGHLHRIDVLERADSVDDSDARRRFGVIFVFHDTWGVHCEEIVQLRLGIGHPSILSGILRWDASGLCTR